MKALVLSGGGAHGAYEAGVAKALLAREDFDVICGVSIGAINAALIAAGNDGALEHFWYREFPAHALRLFPHVPRLRRLIGHLGAIGQGNPWKDAMSVARTASALPFLRNLGNVHKTSLPVVADALAAMVDFKQLRKSLLVGATNASRASAVVFRASAGTNRLSVHRHPLTEYHDLTDENFVLALLASSAMPGLFSPIELTFGEESALYADGCLVHTSPLGLAIDNGATEVTVVFVDQELDSQTTDAAHNLPQMAYNIATLWQQRFLEYEVRLAAATNEVVRLGGAPGKRQISIRYVRPSRPLELDMLAFDDQSALVDAFERGLIDGAAPPRIKLPEAAPERAPVPAIAVAANDGERFWDSMRRIFARPSLKRTG
ncbi:MAG TPA: patatin-like phospholipase family protein [Candidatus Baltobacteraceae bacterium]|nr:patatin-like phospholipase family protein [Candidatus Baltobacteraceae bacterium]